MEKLFGIIPSGCLFRKVHEEHEGVERQVDPEHGEDVEPEQEEDEGFVVGDTDDVLHERAEVVEAVDELGKLFWGVEVVGGDINKLRNTRRTIQVLQQ